MDAETSITSFYNDKVIFITGGSGFLGKVLIEKLLRCCPGVKKLLILLRTKKGRTAEERVKSLFNIELFKVLRSQYPNFEEKIQPIAGDIMQDKLGISDDDRKLLQEDVHIVIHSAATVRFDEKLGIAIRMNVVGVKQMLELCQGIKHLQMLCHVSTAYSNCDKDSIEERIYPVSVDPDNLIKTTEWMTEEMLEAVTPSLLGKYPNTYTFTKGLAESVVNAANGTMPITIFRPSVITGSYVEPFPGWIDNYNGPSGIIAAAGKGMLRTMISCQDVVADVVPVDFVVNALLAATWQSAMQKSDQIPIFNCTSGNVNPLTWKMLGEKGAKVLEKYPFDEIFRRPNFSFATNKLSFFYWTYVSHRIPAMIADGMAVLVGGKPRICRLYDRLDKAVACLQFFTNRGWNWESDNLFRLRSAIHVDEKETFNFDMATIDWNDYIEIFVLGVKQYLMKDKLEDLGKARWQVTRYRLVRWISCTLFFIMTWRVLFTRSERFRHLWFRVVFAVYRALRYVNLVSI